MIYRILSSKVTWNSYYQDHLFNPYFQLILVKPEYPAKRVFSLTWSMSMFFYQKKRKHLHWEWVWFPEDLLGDQHGCRSFVYRHQHGRCDVTWKHCRTRIKMSAIAGDYWPQINDLPNIVKWSKVELKLSRFFISLGLIFRDSLPWMPEVFLSLGDGILRSVERNLENLTSMPRLIDNEKTSNLMRDIRNLPISILGSHGTFVLFTLM